MSVLRLPNTSAFKDVPSDSYAIGYINRGQMYGIVNGIAPDTFGYGQGVKREEMATFVVRAFERSAIVSLLLSGSVLIGVYYLMKKM